MAAVVSDAFLSELEATRARYEERAPERERVREILDRDGILHADTSQRVTRGGKPRRSGRRPRSMVALPPSRLE